MSCRSLRVALAFTTLVFTTTVLKYTPQGSLRTATRLRHMSRCRGERLRHARAANLGLGVRSAVRHASTVGTDQSSTIQGSSVTGENIQAWDSKYAESRGKIKYGTWKLQGVRETMEDQYHVITRARCGFLYASVFDGHGGDAASDYLRWNMYQLFNEAIEKEPFEVAPIDEDTPDAEWNPEEIGLSCPIVFTRILTSMFEHMDQKLLKYLETVEDDDQARSGSTATVALVRKDRIIIANVGDSRAVLGRGEWAIDLSKEHRAYGDSYSTWNEICRIEECGAWVDDGRVLDILGITRAFGDPDFKGEGLDQLKRMCVENGYWAEEFADNLEFSGDPIICTPDVTEIAVTPQDNVLIVATDGLWDVYESEEAVYLSNLMLESGETPEKIARTLCELAIENGSQDNVSVVVIDLRGMHDQPDVNARPSTNCEPEASN